MEQLQKDMGDIWASIDYHEAQLRSLREALAKKKEEMKVICIHEYRREDDGDYHRPRYYYICSRCGNVTYSLGNNNNLVN